MIERDWTKPLKLEMVEPESQYKPDQLDLPDAPLMFAHFGGIKTMEEHKRLKVILYRVKRLMSDGKWRTHEEMGQLCGCKPTTAASKLRDLKTIGFGSHKVDRDPDPERPHCYIYRLTLNPEDADAKRWAKEAEDKNRRYFFAKHPKPFKTAMAWLLVLFLGASMARADINPSSTAFVASLALINADGNMTSWNILHDPTHPWEMNPIAAPFATGESHYLYTAGTCGALILGRSLLTDLDHQLGLNDLGFKDLLTLGILGTEAWAINRWIPYKDDARGEILLSEVEFLLTASVLNLNF